MAKLFQPTVVVGLGGTGKGVLLALKKMIAENSPNGMADYPLLKLLSIDTDVRIDDSTSSIQTIRRSELTLGREKETCSLHADFSIVPDLKDFPDIASWFPQSLRHYLTPSELENGAGQRKPIGRFSFAWNAEAVRTRLENALRAPVNGEVARRAGIGSANLSPFTNVFICGSLCGGTCAGSFLDVAYLVRFIASSLNRNVFVYGLLALSSIFEGLGGDANIRPNCYASLLELDHFMNSVNFLNENRRFFPAYKNIGPGQWNYRKSSEIGPFDFPFLFDKTNGAGFSLNSMKAYSEMAARFIYLLTGHEVARQWQSQDNNVRKLLDVSYNRALLNKPNNYRSMGTFSLLFPRRMVCQICAYRLADSYFTQILDDSYSPQEIENLAVRFLDDTRFNPANGILASEFDRFQQGDAPVESFVGYIDSRRDDLIDDCASADKREIVQKVREWREQMERVVGEYKRQNSVTARNLRGKFLSDVSRRIAAFVDLSLTKDESNRTSEGEPRTVRGSLVRALKFTERLEAAFTEAAELFRREEEAALAGVPNFDSDFRAALDDLDAAADSFFSTKGRLAERLETAASACVSFLNARRTALVAGWARQLLNGIREENNVLRYDGLLSELSKIRLALQRGVNEFRSLHEDARSYLAGKRTYESSYQCDVIFDYREDVEGTYSRLLADKGEDFVFGDLSRRLKDPESGFGDDYSNLATLSKEQMRLALLRVTESYFLEPVRSVSIADRLLRTPEKLNLLLNGNYYNNASIYLNLDGAELARVNLSLQSSTFFAVTIPDRMGDIPYENCPCRGCGEAGSGRMACPVDENPEVYKGDKACPSYPNCLKKHIMDNAPRNLVIVPTEERAEVNIVATVAGFPLHALPTATSVCRPVYEQRRERLALDELHAFGKVVFDDLSERTEDPAAMARPFRKELVFALAVGRLSVQPLSVDFVTQRDLQAGRRDKPSLHLGRDVSEVLERFQSTRADDQAAVRQVQDELEFFRGKVRGDKADLMARTEAKLRRSFDEFSRELPPGFSVDDLDLLSECSEELCGVPLIVENSEIDWGL